MNLVIVTGRMARDPIMRQSRKTGKVFCSMRFCIEGDYRGNQVERTAQFVDVLAFGDKGRSMQKYIRKGMRMLLLASIDIYDSVDPYGQKRQSFSLTVKSYEMIDSRYTENPIRGLSDGDGTYLIPREITDSLVKQVDTKDEDVPDEFSDVEGSADDLL